MSGLSSITFNRAEGGLGRPLPGEDHVSGLIFYKPAATSLPTGFSSGRNKTFFALAEAEAAGIIEGHADFSVLWYHIREFFRIEPKGILHVHIADEAANFALHPFVEIQTLQQFALGKIRQLGIYLRQHEGYSSAISGAVQAQAQLLYNEKMPLIVVVTTDITLVSDLSQLPDRRTESNYYVSWDIAQDGNAKGRALFNTLEYTIGCTGAILGAMARAQVHESIGHPRRFKISDSELDTAAYGNGQVVATTAASLQDQLFNRGYIALRLIQGVAGSFFSGAPTGTSATSDYAYQNANRTVDKAVRQVYAALALEMNGTVLTDPDTGYLSETYIEYLKGLGNDALAQMERDGELAGSQVIINPEQDVVSTGNIDITIELATLGISRQFTIDIGQVTALSNG